MLNNNFRWSILVSWAIFLASTASVDSQSFSETAVPHQIQAGEPVSASGLNSNFEYLVRRINNLQTELQIQIEENRFLAKETDFQISKINLQSAVVAFDRSEKEGACPQGWSLFTPAGGRVVVGAGVHRNEDMNGALLSAHTSFAENEKASIGGEEVHNLSVDEMPRHNHSFASNPVTRGGWGGQATRTFAVGGSEPVSDLVVGGTVGLNGGDQPHNNMPPFVALYYCKFDG